MRVEMRYMIFWISFCLIYTIHFLPDIYAVFIIWQRGHDIKDAFVLLQSGGIGINWATNNIPRSSYNFLYVAFQPFVILILLLNYKPSHKYFMWIFPCWIFYTIVQTYVGFEFEFLKYSEWGWKPVCRFLDFTREISFIALLWLILKSIPRKYQKERLLWLCFNIINIANFLLILAFKFILNRSMPISVWIWTSLVLCLATVAYILIRPIIDMQKIKGEPFDPSKNGLLIAPSPSIWHLWLTLLRSKEGGCLIYFADPQLFYGIRRKKGQHKGQFGGMSLSSKKIDTLKFLPLPFQPKATRRQWEQVYPETLRQEGKSFHWINFSCWEANGALLRSAIGYGYKWLMKENLHV